MTRTHQMARISQHHKGPLQEEEEEVYKCNARSPLEQQ